MSLLSHASSYQIQIPTGRLVAGTPLPFTAVPTEILDLPLLEVLTGPVNLDILLKHVQLPPEAGVVAWPPPATVTSLINSITSGLTAPPEANTTEGWLASISGTLPIGTRDVSSQIRLDLEWRFTDAETGEEVAEKAIVSGGLDAAAVTIVIPPVVTELTTADFSGALATAPATKRLGVQLAVRGRIGTTVDTGEILIPDTPLELELFPIPLPSVAAIFRDQDLTGDAVLLMVPKGSPFESAATLMGVLAPIQSLLGTVNAAALTTTWATGTRGLYSAVSALAERLPLTTHVGFKNRESHNDLGKYNFIVVDWAFDKDIEDRGTSALIVSATRAISFFEHDDFGGKKLELNAVPIISNRFGGAVVLRLHASIPQSTPPGCVSSTGIPGGGEWDDVISSYRWEPALGE